MDQDSGDLSDGLDEFEASAEERQAKKGDAQNYANKPYDEAYELSQDLSVNESYDARDAKVRGPHKPLTVVATISPAIVSHSHALFPQRSIVTTAHQQHHG